MKKKCEMGQLKFFQIWRWGESERHDKIASTNDKKEALCWTNSKGLAFW